MGRYAVAEVCKNGHPTTDDIQDYPERRAAFCPECGAPTLTACESCNEPIRGDYEVPGVVVISTYHPPGFCFKCGKPFPWSAAKLSAAQELAGELEDISESDRQVLKDSIGDLTRDTAKTEVAAVRVKKILKKAGGAALSGLQKVLVDIASETAKKALGL
jgi:hypothetical protein